MNNSKLYPRKIKEEDWDTLKKWWDYWPGVEAPPRDFLPDNGTGGIMIEDNEEPVIAGFIYRTNSSCAILEWIISSPNYRGKKKRDEALEFLITCLQTVVKEMGYRTIVAMIRNKKIINLREKFAWKIDLKPNYTHIKIL